MKTFSVSKVNFAACAGMAYFGVAMLSLGAILPPLKVAVPEAMGLPPIMSVGIIIGTILFGPVMDRFGYKWLLIISSFLLMLGLLGLAAGAHLGLQQNVVLNFLRVSIFLVGLGGGVLNGETNALVSDIYDDEHRGSKLSVLGACYCIGALLWTLACFATSDLLVKFAGVAVNGYQFCLIVFSVIMAALIIFFICTTFPEAKLKAVANSVGKPVKSAAEEINFWNSFKFIKYPALVLVAAVLFFQSALEGTSGSYTTSFLTAIPGGLAANIATLSLTMFTIGMMAGRFALGALMKKMQSIMVLNFYMVVGVVGAILMSFLPASITAVYASMILLGFGVGATYPVMLNYLGGIFRRQSGAAFSLAIFIALCGQFLGNFFVGKMFTTQSIFTGVFKFFPIVMGVFILIIIAIAPLAAKKCEKTKEENQKKGIKL
jgi:MFS family permease